MQTIIISTLFIIFLERERERERVDKLPAAIRMDSDSDNDPSGDDSSASTATLMIEEWWRDTLQMIGENDPQQKQLILIGNPNHAQDITDEEWEELGRDISNNTHLNRLDLCHGALNNNRMSCLFRGLTRSSCIKELGFYDNEFSLAGVQKMVPFLQGANSLTRLDLNGNNIQSEGFNLLFRALSDSPIEELRCSRNRIETLEIDIEHIPEHLKHLYLSINNISVDGCRGLAKLLQGNVNMESLHLDYNDIDDEGVAILVDALQSNTTLEGLDLQENVDISNQGKMKLLKLVSDISSITATLQSNHTLTYIIVECNEHDQFQDHIDNATDINSETDSPEAAGRQKVIETQLDSKRRAELAELQGVNQSLYSEIDPLHLPEVLALVGRRHGKGELYVALKASIAGVISTVNRKECIRQQMAYHKKQMAQHAEKLKELGTELAAIEAAEGTSSE